MGIEERGRPIVIDRINSLGLKLEAIQSGGALYLHQNIQAALHELLMVLRDVDSRLAALEAKRRP